MAEAGAGGKTQWQRVAKRIRVPMGFAFAAVYLWLAKPTLVSMLLSLLLVAPGLSLRAYAAGYVRKNAELTTTGPYAYTRNPLYLGSMLIAFGFAAAAGSWVLLLVLLGLFAAIYVPTIQAEEVYLRAYFAGFDAYAAEVPRILPRFKAARIGTGRSTPTGEPLGSFSRALYRHHREYNALMGACAIYLALLLRLYLKHLHPFIAR